MKISCSSIANVKIVCKVPYCITSLISEMYLETNFVIEFNSRQVNCLLAYVLQNPPITFRNQVTRPCNT
jgi:hypothetical protein